MDFAVFICTHGRPTAQHTLKALRTAGYSGKIYLVVDDEDPTVDGLRVVSQEYAAEILMFNKHLFISRSDTGTNEIHNKCILYAKNFCEQVALEKNLTAFVIADDDIVGFRFRYKNEGHLRSARVYSTLDGIFSLLVEYMLSTDMLALGMGYPQMYFNSDEDISKHRIPYQFVFRNVSKKVEWMSWFQEDIVTAIYYNSIGELLLSLPIVQLMVMSCDGEDGGMKSEYVSNPSIKRAMQQFVYLPSMFKIKWSKQMYKACVQWNNAYPKVLSGRYKK